MAKWRARADEPAGMQMPAVASAARYSQRVLPVLMYTAGMCRAPLELARLERDALGRTLRFPGSTMPARGHWCLRQWGFADFGDVAVACAVEFATRAQVTEVQRRRLCTLPGRGFEEMRPMSPSAASWDMCAPGTPIIIARRDAIAPIAAPTPVERAVARVLQATPKRFVEC